MRGSAVTPAGSSVTPVEHVPMINLRRFTTMSGVRPVTHSTAACVMLLRGYGDRQLKLVAGEIKRTADGIYDSSVTPPHCAFEQLGV